MKEMIEIERKYLFDDFDFDLSEFEKVEIEQGYVCHSPAIRIRRWNEKYLLTVKSDSPLERSEYEFELTFEQYRNLQAKAEPKYIRKTRYLIPIEKYTAELDVYHDELDGLMTVEVEFKSIEDARKFIPPNWFGREVTFDVRYCNSNLSKNGIPID